jgi:hypothetical protein
MNSRKVTQATEIAERWVERLKTDALLWRAAGTTGLSGTPCTTAPCYLSDLTTTENANLWLPAAGALTNGVNCTLGHAAGATFLGEDITDACDGGTSQAPDPTFCTSYRLNWLNGDSVNDTGIRADVVVFWPRERSPANMATHFPGCAPSQGVLDFDVNDDGNNDYHAVYATTVVRYTLAQ